MIGRYEAFTSLKDVALWYSGSVRSYLGEQWRELGLCYTLGVPLFYLVESKESVFCRKLPLQWIEENLLLSRLRFPVLQWAMHIIIPMTSFLGSWFAWTNVFLCIIVGQISDETTYLCWVHNHVIVMLRLAHLSLFVILVDQLNVWWGSCLIKNLARGLFSWRLKLLLRLHDAFGSSQFSYRFLFHLNLKLSR